MGSSLFPERKTEKKRREKNNSWHAFSTFETENLKDTQFLNHTTNLESQIHGLEK